MARSARRNPHRIAPLAALLALAAAGPARAELRLLVAVGADAGLAGDARLRHVRQDAARVAAVFTELGGVDRVLAPSGGDAGKLRSTLRLAREEVASAHQRGERVMLLFFYSGHADADGLRLHRTRLAWEDLKAELRAVGAETTVSFVDACSSGGAAPKGASPGAPFTVEREVDQARGMVWFTSSRGEEASYESDELGGSLFTHYLVSALRGAADLDENGRITLDELYRYTYQQTVGETSLRLRTVQHPTYEIELAGEGEVVLTELPRAGASLVLPRELEGLFFVTRRFGPHRSTLEVAKQRGTLTRLSVGEGAFLVYRRDEDRVWLASYAVSAGQEVVVEGADLKERRYEPLARKGGALSLPTWQAYLTGGAAGPPLRGGPAVAPAMRLGALRRASWVGLGLEAGYSRFRFDAVDTGVDNRALDLLVRGELFRETRLGVVSLGLGAGGLLLAQRPGRGAGQRSFSAGLVLGGALERRLFGRASLRADASLAAWFLPASASRISPRLSPRLGIGLAVALQ